MLANDTGLAAGSTAVLVTPPTAAQGALTLNPDGSFTFTPAAGFSGTATFTYRAVAGGVPSAPATVTITVPSTVTSPVVNDSFTVLAGRTLTVAAPGVLANDTGLAAGSTAVLGTVPPPAAGALTFNPDGSFTFTPAAGFVGPVTFTYRVTSPAGVTSAAAVVTIQVLVNRTHVVGVGAGGAPRVQVYAEDGAQVLSAYVFEESFTGGIRVAVGDFDGDGTEDVVAGAGFGGGPRVVLFDGATGARAADFYAYPENATFTGGVFVAAGDLDRDGKADVVVGPGSGSTFGPLVRVFDATGRLTHQVLAFERSFSGGVRVAVGDLNGDGYDDVVVGAGLSGGPRVRVFSGKDLSVLADFFAFDPAYRGGVFVTIAGPPDAPVLVVSPDSSPQFAGTTLAQVVTAEGDGAATADQLAGVLTHAPQVYVVSFPGAAGGALGTPAGAAPVPVLDAAFLGGVRVAGGRLDDTDGVFVGAGAGGGGAVQFYPLAGGVLSPTPVTGVGGLDDPNFLGSVYVGAGR